MHDSPKHLLLKKWKVGLLVYSRVVYRIVALYKERVTPQTSGKGLPKLINVKLQKENQNRNITKKKKKTRGKNNRI